MAKRLWGLDFGDWSLKVVRATYDKKAGAITVDLFDEIVYGELDCGYEASPLERHREGVIAFRRKYELGGGDELCVAVSGSEVFHRFVKLPPVPGRLDDIMRYEASQQIPFELDDVVWDWQPVKEEQDREEAEEIEVGLFALKKEKVQELMDLLGPWRRNLRVVQDAPLAVYNLLEYEGRVGESLIVLDVGASTTDVIILNPPRFWVRSLLIAGDDLTNALVEQFGISLQEAERIKRRVGRSTHREQIMRILQPVVDDLTNEILRSLGYYKSIERDVRFETILTLGSTLRMPGLSQSLAGALQYRLGQLGELKRIQLADTVDRARFQTALPSLCAALGLLVQGAGLSRMRINMVPEDVRVGTVLSQKKPWAVAATAGVVLIVGLLILGQVLFRSSLKAVEARVDLRDLTAVQEVERQYNAELKAVQEIENKLKTLSAGGIERNLYQRLLPLFGQCIAGKQVYVTTLDFSWMEPSVVDLGVPPLAETGTTFRAGMSPMMGPMGPMGFGGPPVGFRPTGGPPVRVTGGPTGRVTGGPRIRRTGGARPRGTGLTAGAATSRASGASVLVMRFACESEVNSVEYVREKVLAALRQAKLPGESGQGTDTPAFTKVELLGEVYDVWRDPSTWELATEDQEGAQKLLAFQGYAIVNVGPAATQEGSAGGARPRPGSA